MAESLFCRGVGRIDLTPESSMGDSGTIKIKVADGLEGVEICSDEPSSAWSPMACNTSTACRHISGCQDSVNAWAYGSASNPTCFRVCQSDVEFRQISKPSHAKILFDAQFYP